MSCAESHSSASRPTLGIAAADQVVRGAGAVDDDIETVAFLVLFEASRSVQDDLREILEQARAINHAKAKLGTARERTTAKTSLDVESVLQLMLTAYGKTIESELDALQRDLDSPMRWVSGRACACRWRWIA